MSKSRMFLKFSLVSTDSLSFTPTWRTILTMVDGRVARMVGRRLRMNVEFAPGKQYFNAFEMRIFLTMESPMINTVGGGGG